MWAPEHAGSIVVVYNSVWAQLPVACGVLVAQPETEPTSPALQGRFLTTEPLGSPLILPILSVDKMDVQKW